MKAYSSRSGINIDSFTEDSIAGPSQDFVGVGLRVTVDYIEDLATIVEGLATIVVHCPNTGPTGSLVLAGTNGYRTVSHTTYLISNVRACTLCGSQLPLKPSPIIRH